MAAIALVPAPREQAWRDGTCVFADGDVRNVRDAALPPEGYRLDIEPGGVTVASADDAGAFYARQTLRQLADGGAFGTVRHTNEVPCGTIADYPAFRWRGFMLDEALPSQFVYAGTPASGVLVLDFPKNRPMTAFDTWMTCAKKSQIVIRTPAMSSSNWTSDTDNFVPLADVTDTPSAEVLAVKRIVGQYAGCWLAEIPHLGPIIMVW